MSYIHIRLTKNTSLGDLVAFFTLYIVKLIAGTSLVSMQIYHTLSRLFRPGAPPLSLYDTTLKDIKAVQYDFHTFLPCYRPGITAMALPLFGI